MDQPARSRRPVVPGRFPAGHLMVASLGAASVADAVRAARAAGVTALTLATVSDFAVLSELTAIG